MSLLNLFASMPIMDKAIGIGMIAIGAALCVCTGAFSSLGEAKICCHAIDAMARNPEERGNLQSTMILAVALDESCAIYALIVAILIVFILPGNLAA